MKLFEDYESFDSCTYSCSNSHSSYTESLDFYEEWISFSYLLKKNDFLLILNSIYSPDKVCATSSFDLFHILSGKIMPHYDSSQMCKTD